MDVGELRRVQLARETLGFLVIPAVYFALMAVGVFQWRPDLGMVTVALVVLLILQGRAGRLSSRLASRESSPAKGPRMPAAAVEAADSRFLRAEALSVVAQAAGYLAFLAALDQALRGSAQAPAGLALGAAAVSIVAVMLLREAARRSVWKGFAAGFPEVWSGPGGLGGWRGVRTAADYLEWRSGVDRHE